MAFKNKRNGYNWVSDIIRVDSEPWVIKSDYVSPQRIKDENQYKEKLVSWLNLLEDEFAKKAADSQYVDTISKMRTVIIDILDEYHAGNIGSSYEKMKSIIFEMMAESSELSTSTIQKSFAFNDVEDVLNDSVPKTQIEFFRATTSYCCWLELKTPADHQFNVSLVRVNQERKILNLTMTAELFEHIVMLTKTDKLANKYTWDIAKSIKVMALSYI